MENGTLLNGHLFIKKNNNNNNIYNIFKNYFNNPIMTKIKENNNISSYFAKISTGLITTNRYLIVNVENDNNTINKKIYLKNLKWISLQTRSININYNIDSFTYDNNKLDNILLTVKDRKINEKGLDYTIYNCDGLNIEIYVFHTKKNNKYEYPEKAYLSNAIEEYKTLINII